MARIPRLGIQLREMKASMPHQTVQVGRHQRKVRPPSQGDGKRGAPAVYDPVRFPHMAHVLCKEYGFTAEQMGKVFGVSVKTVNSWMQLHPEFKQAVQAGKDEFDSVKVESALLKIALGYSFEEKTTKTVYLRGKSAEGDKIRVPAREVTTTVKQLPPNAKAIAFWLTNRQRDRWQMVSTVNANINSKTEHTTKTLQVTADFSKMDSKQLRALRDLVTTQKTDNLEIENNQENTLLLEMLDSARGVMDAEYDDTWDMDKPQLEDTDEC